MTYDNNAYKENGIDADPDNRPVIWIWNDNSTQRTIDHYGTAIIGDSVAMSHWEGFRQADPRETEARLIRRKRVQDWNFGHRMAEDISNGVWRVSKTFKATGRNFLDVFAGAFVRGHPVPNGVVVSPDHMYMYVQTA